MGDLVGVLGQGFVVVLAGALGVEAEVSGAIVFLLSPGASYVSGACLCVDGGSSLNTKLFQLPEHDRMPAQNAFHRAVRPKAVTGA